MRGQKLSLFIKLANSFFLFRADLFTRDVFRHRRSADPTLPYLDTRRLRLSRLLTCGFVSSKR